MNGSPLLTCLLVVSLYLAALPVQVRAQGWAVDVSAGRIVYDPVSVNLGTNNVMGTLRYDTTRDMWVYGTAAAPLRTSDPVWGAFGAGGRVQPTDASLRRTFVGADLGAHAFLFRDSVVDQSGRGGTVEAMPFASLAAGQGTRVEVRGGWRGQTLTFAGSSESRDIFETGVRGIYSALVRVQGDLKWVRANEGTYPFVSGSLTYGGAPVQLWMQTGKWMSDTLGEVEWGFGGGMALGAWATLWASLRQESPDPLYWNAPRRTWSIGITHYLGRRITALPVMPRPDSDGGVLIRVPTADVRGDTLFIAGDFNQWQATPMRREGSVWVIHLPLSPGVYNYAFRSAKGEWFVPSSIAGRRDDGMGGHVAVLVVG